MELKPLLKQCSRQIIGCILLRVRTGKASRTKLLVTRFQKQGIIQQFSPFFIYIEVV
jgi:hypothetical protein